jgi:predicted aspartyl protease
LTEKGFAQMSTASLDLTESYPRPRKFLVVLLLVQGLAVQCTPAQKVSLDDYLKKLGCESVLLRRTEGNELLADGKLGERNCVFLVDTGWGGITTIGEKVGGRFKSLGELRVTLEDSLLGPLTNSSIVLVDRLVLGRAEFVNQPARVQKLEVDYISVPFDAALGRDFFLRNHCLIDCPGHRLYFRAQRPTADQAKALAETLEGSGFVGVKMTNGRVLSVEAQVNDQPVRLLVDTGATYSVLDEASAQALGLRHLKTKQAPTGSLIPEEVNSGFVGMGNIGRHKMWVTTLAHFQLGSSAWKDLYFGVVNLKAWKLDSHGNGRDAVHGLLGADLLTANHALIDLSTGMLWLLPPKSAQH